MRALFYASVGLLPLWLGIAFVVYVFQTIHGGEAAMSAWVFVVAIPACVVTLGLVAATLAVHDAVKGEAARKFLFATGFFILVVVALVIAGGIW